MKASELIEQATKEGCETVTDYATWCYQKGRVDMMSELTKKQETIPDHMNAAIAEQEENERRMEQKEAREHYADYSDQGEEHD